VSKYLDRTQILSSAVKTEDVEAFGGVVCVKELDALTMKGIMEGGGYDSDTGALDMGKIDLIALAAHHIVNPETMERVLNRGDVQKLATKSWADIVNVATAALRLSGLDVEEETEPEKND